MPEMVGPKLLVWGVDLIEGKTLAQAGATASLPFVESPLALMPDAHWGRGATIGSVIATSGAVIPAAVGVDIGCGMIAAPLPVTASQLPDDLGPMHAALAAAIPAGVGREQVRATGEAFMDRTKLSMPDQVSYGSKLATTALVQLGTLGGGNHFVELCADENEDVWLVLHSGSRGTGKQLAEVYITAAKGKMRDYFVNLPDEDLAYLVQGSPEFDAYIRAMLWAQDYARENRRLMMAAAVVAVSSALGRIVAPDPGQVVNCHHNFTELEHHRGRDVWVTRKGAIRARVSDRGVIPGSMGTSTFIVRGKGSAASWHSCSHGAGRAMSRGQAKRELSVESLERRMEGISWNAGDARSLVDEHPESYKDVHAVMAAQADLVEVEHTLHQLLNLKGTK